MQVHLDEVRVELSGTTLAELLRSAKKRLSAAHRVVVEVKLDGLTLTAEEIEAASGKRVAGELKLFSADPRQLGAAALEQARQRLPEAAGHQEQAAEMLQKDEPSAALKKLAEALEIWMQTRQAISDSTELLGLGPGEFQIEGQSLAVHIDELFQSLKGLKGMITAGDHSGLADSLAYEWPEITEKWQTILLKLAEKLLKTTGRLA
ncbi:MAG: hypothetical protein JJU36_09745 [Phycisphaeraceae bacterium]|nr:hypothetical protein [Phycisphaeraceae bacterium]